MNSKEELIEIDKRAIEIRSRITFFWQFYMTYAVFALGYLVTNKKPEVNIDCIAKLILTSFHFTFVFMNIMALYPRYRQLERINNLLLKAKMKFETDKFAELVLGDLKRTLAGDLFVKKFFWIIHVGATAMILYLLWR